MRPSDSIVSNSSEEWTIHPIPQKGELFSSWICRLARANFLSINQLFHGFSTYNVDIDIRPYDWFISELVDHTKIPAEEIKEMLINEWDELFGLKRTQGLYKITGRPHYKIGFRVCPICLKADRVPFYRKLWRISAVTACLEHKCLLVDRCPKCGSHIDPKRIELGVSFTACFNCGFDLKDASVHLLNASDPFLEAVKELSSCKDLEKYTKIYKISMELSKYSSLSDSFYNNNPLIKNPLIKKLFDSDRKNLFTAVESVHLIIGAAWDILRDNKKLDQFLRQNNSCNEHFWNYKPYCCHLGSHDNRFLHESNFDQSLYASEGVELFKCPKCGLEFTQKITMEKHFNTHEKDVLTFYTKSDLLKHIQLHEKDFICPECSLRFSQEKYLRSHLRVHIEEKPYKCPMCKKGFKRKTYLNIHIRTHSDERPYRCAECGKMFRKKTHLDSHTRIHTGERPFECPECKRRFRQKISLSKHLKRFHE